jgi:hypothetical protein
MLLVKWLFSVLVADFSQRCQVTVKPDTSWQNGLACGRLDLVRGMVLWYEDRLIHTFDTGLIALYLGVVVG